MTKEELVKKLKEADENAWDSEEAHIKADRLLLEYINDEEVTRTFEAIHKWYA